jgi:hypothetical protein
MKFVFIIFSIFLLSNQIKAAETGVLKDFITDGCTMFIDGPDDNPTLWRHCCVEHDLRYWFGGTLQNRDFADLQLKACVKDCAGDFWANLIYNGVQAGQFSPIHHKYSWSWAWEPKRENSELSPDEIQYVIKRLNDVDMTPEYRESFIKKYLGVRREK